MANDSSNSSFYFLNQLTEECDGPIHVMICRKWDVTSVADRYISSDFVVSDEKGDTIHCTSRPNASHRFVDRLQVGVMYLMKGFSVIPNREDFRIFKDDTYMIELTGSTCVKKVAAKVSLFNPYPYQFVDFANLQPTRNKFMIDVIGYVANIGRIMPLKTGLRTLDFYLVNERMESVRVTLWGNLGEELLKMRAENEDPFVLILTAVAAKTYNDRLYISSSSSTLLIDSQSIPAIIEFRKSIAGLKIKQEFLPLDKAMAIPGTLEDLLDWGKNIKKDLATFHCIAKIINVRTKMGWHYLSCGGSNCRKGITRRNGKFWCQGCRQPIEYPIARYRLELDVSDGESRVVFVLFDEAAKELVKCSARSLLDAEDESMDLVTALPNSISNIINTTHTFEIKAHTHYQYGGYESFTCACIFPPPAENIAGSRTPDVTLLPEATVDEPLSAEGNVDKCSLKRLSGGPILSTPTKDYEKNKPNSFILEDSDAEESEVVGHDIVGHKKKKRIVAEDLE